MVYYTIFCDFDDFCTFLRRKLENWLFPGKKNVKKCPIIN